MTNTYDPLGEVEVHEDDGIQSFSFESTGDTVEGEIIKIAEGWTTPKVNKWGNLTSYLPITLRTAEGEEWRVWPMAQVYEDTGRKVPKEFTKVLIDAVKASTGALSVGGRLKVRYDGKVERTTKSGTTFEVGTYTMRYTPPAPTAPLDLDEF